MATASERLREAAGDAWRRVDELDHQLIEYAEAVRANALDLGLWSPTPLEDSLALLDVPEYRPSQLRAAGILATGITRHPHTGAYVPAVLARNDVPQLQVSITQDDTPWLRPMWQLLHSVEIHPDETVLIALPEPVVQVGPADTAACSGPPGTFGARIWTSDRARGILTAGHVAPRVGASAYDGNAGYVGTVIETHDLSCLPFRTPGIDVAVIELAATTLDTKSSPAASTPGDIWDDVVGFGAVHHNEPGQLLSAGRPFAGPHRQQGIWDDALVTDRAISSGGDSGGMVLHRGTGALIGHIVGGYPGVYTVVQDAEAQLNKLQARLH